MFGVRVPSTFGWCLLSAAVVLAMFADVSEAFQYSGYCQKMCKYGRGGNLCKCSAVHFAGKRQREDPDDGGYGQRYPGGVAFDDQKRRRFVDRADDADADGSWLGEQRGSPKWARFLDREPTVEKLAATQLGLRRRRRAERRD